MSDDPGSYTYENRWIVKNEEGLHCHGCGGLHPYWTKGCKPALVPDQWDDYQRHLGRDQAPLDMDVTLMYEPPVAA